MTYRDQIDLTYKIGATETTVAVWGTVVAEDTSAERGDGTFHASPAPRYRLIMPATLTDLPAASHVRAIWAGVTLVLDTPILAYNRNGRVDHYEAVSRRIGSTAG